MRKNGLNIFLSLGLLGLIFVPMAINHSGIFNRLIVHGVEPSMNEEKTSWWDGSAQKQFAENQMSTSIARTYFMRIRNQYQYSLFHKINAQDIYEYDGQFFRFYSIGFNEKTNFIGSDKVRDKVQLLKKLQTRVGDKVPIITVIPPYKTHYFKEFLPSKHLTTSEETNYIQFLNELEEQQLSVLDFNDYFLEHPSTVPAIFGTGGIHWSEYASAIAMDSLVRFVSKQKGIPFSSFSFDTISNGGFSEQDLDIALLLNRLEKPNDPNLRDIVLTPIAGKRKIKAVIITDSFCFSIFTTGIGETIFTPDTYFHYYFNSVYARNWGTVERNWEQIQEDVFDADCIIILSDVVNLENFGFGFLEKMNESE